MAVDLAELLSPEALRPEAKEQVIAIIRRLPLTASTKRFLYGRWARQVGLAVDPADLDRVAPWRQGPRRQEIGRSVGEFLYGFSLGVLLVVVVLRLWALLAG